MGKFRNFVKRHAKKFICSMALASLSFGSIGAFAEGTTYTPTTIPTGGEFSLDVLQQLWVFGAGMVIDTINIIASQPLLVMLVVALPLVGLGVGLFSRIKHA